MLAKKYRLSGRLEGEFFARAKRQFLPWGVLYYQLLPRASEGQHAIIAGKKNFPLARARHDAKRRLAALLYPVVGKFAPGRYVWVLQRPPKDLPPLDFFRHPT